MDRDKGKGTVVVSKDIVDSSTDIVDFTLTACTIQVCLIFYVGLSRIVQAGSRSSFAAYSCFSCYNLDHFHQHRCNLGRLHQHRCNLGR